MKERVTAEVQAAIEMTERRLLVVETILSDEELKEALFGGHHTLEELARRYLKQVDSMETDLTKLERGARKPVAA